MGKRYVIRVLLASFASLAMSVAQLCAQSEIVLVSAPATAQVGDVVNDPKIIGINDLPLAQPASPAVTMTWIEGGGGSCYAPVSGTRAIAKTSDEGFGSGSYPTSHSIFFRTTFNLPEGYSNPSLSFTATADDEVQVYPNGIHVGGIIDYGTDLCDPPTSFGFQDEAAFHSGENVVELRLINWNDPSGRISLSYKLVMAYTPPGCTPQCVPPPAGLVSWWPGDGNALDIHGSNHGVLLNGATFAPGKVGQGFALDGIDDTVRIEHSPRLKPENQITVDAWIKPHVVDGLREIFRKEDDNDRILFSFQGSECYWSWWDDWGNDVHTQPCLAFGISTGGEYREMQVGGPIIANLADGEFHHVAGSYDGSAKKIYIDGSLAGSYPASGRIGTSGNAPAYIGSSVGSGEFFQGVIDEVEIYSRALSGDEIRAVYLAGAAGKCKNRPPVANAGGDQTVECTGNSCAEVTLDGLASSDPDNDPLSYEWKEGENGVGTTATVGLSAVSLGTHTYTLTVDDGKGGTASDDVMVTVQDTQAPTLTLAHDSATVILPTASASGASVDALAASGAAATDQCDPSPTLAPAGSSQYPLGSTVVQITANDHSGHSVQKPFTVKVAYNFAGFFPPVRMDGASIFRSGRTIPVKFQLTAADGSIVSNATATLLVGKLTNLVTGAFEELTPEASGNSNLDNVFRFDPTAGQYIYNLQATGWSPGTYLLRATLNDGTTHDVYVSVR